MRSKVGTCTYVWGILGARHNYTHLKFQWVIIWESALLVWQANSIKNYMIHMYVPKVHPKHKHISDVPLNNSDIWKTENVWSQWLEWLFATLVGSAERQLGIANLNYTEYVLDRLELCIGTCSNVLEVINTSDELQDCSASLTELIQCLKVSYKRWGDYKTFLEGPSQRYSPVLTTQLVGRRGRPRF